MDDASAAMLRISKQRALSKPQQAAAARPAAAVAAASS
jgi:hypothetical protein